MQQHNLTIGQAILNYAFSTLTFIKYIALTFLELVSFQEVKKFFCSPPCSLTNRIAISHSGLFGDIVHVLIIVFKNDRFLSFAIFITKVAICWLSMHIYQHVHVSHTFPNYCCWVTSYPGMYVTPFQFLCLTVKDTWHSFMILSDSPTTADTSCVWREETVHVKFMTYPFCLTSH